MTMIFVEFKYVDHACVHVHNNCFHYDVSSIKVIIDYTRESQ